MTVWFIDTSILVHILDIPGLSKSGHPSRDEALSDLRARTAQKDIFLLPITTVIETGNHICQLDDGQQRRRAAERFRGVLQKIIDGEAPWRLNEVQWDHDFLASFLNGAATQQQWVEHACQQTLGGGDMSILVEREQYQMRTGLRDVRIWTLDHQLQAFALVDRETPSGHAATGHNTPHR
ncbi:hypothetical protein J5X07_06045 [Actinomyces bowdenii]|uniref:hypothetical protein n=1 Tax=Actinomyces bowdenii TaxID=131109 RepID=UPI001ABD3075|nr:hypothetical protein [Actinomyces bowdenii]MBO3724594.1 hypothetical protein [Actinomyces bowdenii]